MINIKLYESGLKPMFMYVHEVIKVMMPKSKATGF